MRVLDEVVRDRYWCERKGFEFGRVDSSVTGSYTGDPGRMRQILLNLVGNAIKFTQQGGVSIHLAELPHDDRRVTLRVGVQDTGIGISKEHVGRLFQQFTQLDSSTTRKFGGTGLGLAITRQLVELMGGQIGVESEEGAAKISVQCPIGARAETLRAGECRKLGIQFRLGDLQRESPGGAGEGGGRFHSWQVGKILRLRATGYFAHP